jgi:hypothetical protein
MFTVFIPVITNLLYALEYLSMIGMYSFANLSDYYAVCENVFYEYNLLFRELCIKTHIRIKTVVMMNGHKHGCKHCNTFHKDNVERRAE